MLLKDISNNNIVFVKAISLMYKMTPIVMNVITPVWIAMVTNKIIVNRAC